MKKFYVFSIVLSILATASTFAQFASGSGTINNPYVINTVAHLQAMHTADYTNPLYFKLTSDLDMQGVNWIPVNSVDPYAKQIHFDGNGHVIKNLTVVGASYASLFGVLCGSCKNLGVINADIESSNGGGIIAGYAGLKGPGKPTGMIINCYTTGKVSGSDGVGGIVGNIGKPNGDELSGVKNCYSTADVVAINTTGNSRAGGIAGIVFERGVLENCYATGTVKSHNFGAGGIIGWTDASVKGLVAMNDSVINVNTGNIARISAFMGRINDVIAQGENCWAYSGMVVKDADYVLVESDFKKGLVAERNTPFDGVTKTGAFLSDPMSYFLELGWDFASDNNIWAQTMSNGKPIFQWLFARADYAQIDGHSATTAVKNPFFDATKVYIQNGELHVKSDNPIEAILVYNVTGQMIFKNMNVNKPATIIPLNQSGVKIVSILSAGEWSSVKLISK